MNMPDTDAVVLDAQEGFSLAGFIQSVHDKVPKTITREQALATLEALQATYDHPNIERRLALLAEDCEIEDPAGLPRGGGRAGMEAFFRSTFDNGVRINRRPMERIVVGNEAIECTAMTLEMDGQAPHPLAHICHYVFDDSARIRKMRVFFDMKSIFRQPTQSTQGGWC
jgi:hypothetical protein